MNNADYIKEPENIYPNNKSSTINIYEMPFFDQEQYDILNPKDYAKFIADIERCIRTQSYEYRTLINYLRECESMNKCTFLDNISNADTTSIKIHIHHAPFTLFDISCAVVKKRLSIGESIDIFDIMNEVMWLHYMGYVGLVPVCETVHSLIHNQYLIVPFNVVRGNFQKFIDLYKPYIDPTTMDNFDNGLMLTQAYLNNEPNNLILRQMQMFNLHPTYINYPNMQSLLERLSQSKNIIGNRIDTIKNKKKVMCRIIRK